MPALGNFTYRVSLRRTTEWLSIYRYLKKDKENAKLPTKESGRA